LPPRGKEWAIFRDVMDSTEAGHLTRWNNYQGERHIEGGKKKKLAGGEKTGNASKPTFVTQPSLGLQGEEVIGSQGKPGSGVVFGPGSPQGGGTRLAGQQHVPKKEKRDDRERSTAVFTCENVQRSTDR